MTTTTHTRQNCLALPYTATSEVKAEQFAAALESVFIYDIKTEVFEDGGRWGVAVVEGMDCISDPIKDERITAIAILMSTFDLIESTGEVMCLDDPGWRISPSMVAITSARPLLCGASSV